MGFKWPKPKVWRKIAGPVLAVAAVAAVAIPGVGPLVSAGITVGAKSISDYDKKIAAAKAKKDFKLAEKLEAEKQAELDKIASATTAKMAKATAQAQPAVAPKIPTAYIIGGVAVLGIGAMLLMKKR